MLSPIGLQLFIFYRLLRPEFVRDRGQKVFKKINISPDHKFPAVKMTNPMMFAITYARLAVKDKATASNR